ncbi:MAG: hypothetical protein K2G92_00200 [Duncaniella sp.]|nr:hypothetical protein [Duncaniella sp.]
MTKTLRIISTLLLIAYLAVATAMAVRDSGTDRCRGIEITVGGEAKTPFVTAAELARELDSLPAHAAGMPLDEINPQSLRKRLMEVDKIEDVSVVTYTDGTIHISATPIIPVARVFDGNSSYYVNRAGKRVEATARYHSDVPVIAGHFNPADSLFTPLSLLPLINYINNDSVWRSFITMIKVDSPRDIILVPTIREHVVNIGSTARLDDKFSRLRRFYKEVLPVKGWEMYDTVSVKWNGQVVATRRKKNVAPAAMTVYDDEEAVDTGTMLAGDNVAPGQTIPGREAHNEKPIPAATKRTAN